MGAGGGLSEDVATVLAVRGARVYVAGSFRSQVVGFGALALSNPNPTRTELGFLATLTDPTLTAGTAAAGAREPAALFPNPAHRTATVRWPAGVAPAPLTLTDVQGRTVRHYPAPTGPEAALDLRGLPAGLYLLRGIGPSLRLLVQ